jgi:hypothetical protein
VEHDGGKLSRLDLGAFPQVADIIILAKSAKEIAGAEEDGPRAVRAHQRRFLPVVRAETRHGGPAPRLAYTLLALEAVDLAVPGAQPACAKTLDGLAGTFLENPFAVQFQIRRL